MSCCDKPKIFEKKNGKVLHEFNCSNCSGYITVKLNEDLDGAHCIVCPACKHEHYRIIKGGVITEDRAPDRTKSYAIRICPTLAAYSKKSWETKLVNRKTNVKPDGKHFLDEAWKKMTGSQKQHPPQTEEVVEVVPKSKCTPTPKCIACFTDLIDAPGIGVYCPNKKCLQVDNQKTIMKPLPEKDAVKEFTDFKPDVKVDADEISIFDELLIFCKDKKTNRVRLEDYAYAQKWKNMEDKIKFMKEALSK